jgi:hypothetical protein
MELKLILNPTKVLNMKLGEQNVKITLQGTTPYQEAYIEAPKFKTYATQRESEKAGREYVKRVLCHVIKKVEGLKYTDTDGTVKTFEVEFEDTEKEEMTLNSYNKLMRLIDMYADGSSDNIAEAMKFYAQCKQVPDTVQVEGKKKPSKK